jgi:hypothetical protein
MKAVDRVNSVAQKKAENRKRPGAQSSGAEPRPANDRPSQRFTANTASKVLIAFGFPRSNIRRK